MKEPLSKISPNAAAVGTKLKADVLRLRDLPPSDRGDAGSGIAQLNDRKIDFENVLNAGQARIDGLRKQVDEVTSLAAEVSASISDDAFKGFLGEETMASAQSLLGRANDLKSLDLLVLNERQDELAAVTQKLPELKRELTVDRSKYDLAKQLDVRRENLTHDAMPILKYFEQPEIRAYLSTAGVSDLNSLAAKTGALSKLTTVALRDRGDYGNDLAAADAILSRVEYDKHQIEEVLQLRADLKSLTSKFLPWDRDWLDAQTASQLAELERFHGAVKVASVPLPQEQLANAQAITSDLLAKVDDVLSGLQYASKGETSWKVVSKKNEMTDRVDVSALSIQQNEDGAVAEVTGYCDGAYVAFSALIVDSQGNPTLDLPQNLSLDEILGARASIRLNDHAPESKILLPKGNFRNELVIARLAKSPRGPLSDTWRIYMQIDTSRGSVLVKIPIFNKAVQEMINSCRS